MKILVTGGTGFIGRNLVETLAARSHIDLHATFHDRPIEYDTNTTWHHANLCEAKSVERLLAHKFDIVIQAAATTSGAKDILGRPAMHVTDNAVMNSLLLRGYHEAGGGHFIFFSCGIMYPSRETPWTEAEWNGGWQDLIEPQNRGAAHTKLYIERMCEFYAGLGRMRCTVLRNSNIYGPWDKFDDRGHVTGGLLGKAARSKDGTLPVWGDGQEARDLLHVHDLVRLVELVMERKGAPYKIYHASSGYSVKVSDLAAQIASPRGLRVVYDASGPTLGTSLALSPQKALEELNWRPSIGLADGLAMTMEVLG